MDRRLFDIVWEVYRDVDGKQPIKIISAYRSPATNAMLRRRSSGVARHSQHMQGHAMDFFIPGVPLEQIRFAGLRLQRGGVGFYPTSGSPFVHLDVGSIRHWPRMTHDQLARVFPDGRTVHVPSDGKPLKGYELALADIQRRGNGEDVAAPSKSRSFLASLFGRNKSADDEEESTNDAVASGGKVIPVALAAADTAKATVTAAAEKILERVPLPRAKPAGAANYQVASADARTVGLAKPQPALKPIPADEYTPQSPIDIINARGFWDSEPAPKPATQAQIAALKARGAVSAADPQSTASLPQNVAQALAYAPSSAPLDRAQIVAASAPIPRSSRIASLAPNPMSGADINATETSIARTQQGTAATLVRTKATDQSHSIWLRAMILAPSASTSLSASILGDQDMTVMRVHFAKPDAAVAMAFSEDPQMGIVCEKFTGSAIATLSTTPFAMRTASLR